MGNGGEDHSLQILGKVAFHTVTQIIAQISRIISHKLIKNKFALVGPDRIYEVKRTFNVCIIRQISQLDCIVKCNLRFSC